MDCSECSNVSCVMYGIANKSGIQKCFHCEYIKAPMVNKECQRCFDDRDCGFLERVDDECENL